MKKGGLILLLALLVIGNVFFWAEILQGDGQSNATGMAIKGEDKAAENSNIDTYFPAALILIIIANILYLASGRISTKKNMFKKRPKNLKEILRLLNNTDIDTFNEHVNPEINHFADMVRMINPELAVKIYDVTDKVKMAHIIEQHIEEQKPEKSPAELKQEIIELKHELDTFDFSEFEKDL